MKRLGRILSVVAVLLAALVVAAYAILENLDLEYLRKLAQDKVQAYTGRELTIAGPIDLHVSLSPIITLEDVSFANAPWASQRNMVTMKRFELEVDLLPLLSGEIEVRRLILVEPNILLETNDAGEGNWVFGTDDAGTKKAEGGRATTTPVPNFNLLALEDAHFAFHSGATDNTYRLAFESLHAEANKTVRSLSVTGTGKLQDAHFNIAGELGALKTLASGEPYPLDLDLTLADAKLHIAGSVDDDHANLGLELAVSASVPDLSALSEVAGGVLPALGPLEVSGKVTTLDGGYAINQVTAKLGRSDLTGNAEVMLGKARPKVTGEFLSKLLRRADFVGSAKGQGEGKGSANRAEEGSHLLIPDNPLPIEPMRQLDLGLTLQADQLELSEKLSLQKVDLGVQLQDGMLNVSPLRLGLAEGSLDGKLRADVADKAWDVALSLVGKNVNYGQLMRDSDVHSDVSGHLDIDLDLRGRGASPHAIASTLDGKAEIFSEGGKIHSRTLKIFAVGLTDILGPLFGSKSDAKVNCMVARFKLDEGIATSRALLLDSEVMSLAGEGTIDLRDEKLDLLFRTGTRSPSLASLAVPFKVTGTLKNPSVLPDPVAAASGAVKAVAEGAVDTAKSLASTVERLMGKGEGARDDRDACQRALGHASVEAAKPAAATLDQGEPSEKKNAATKDDSSVGGAVDSFKKDLKKVFGD